jgi:DNA replication protein DnaC
MNAHAEIVPSLVDRIKKTLVGLKMPRAIEILDVTLRRIEQGEMTAIEAIDALLAEELMLRESRRIKTALVMARLSTIKTLASFDFSFQPSLDKNRIMALAELEFIDRKEVVHLLGPTASVYSPADRGDKFDPGSPCRIWHRRAGRAQRSHRTAPHCCRPE